MSEMSKYDSTAYSNLACDFCRYPVGVWTLGRSETRFGGYIVLNPADMGKPQFPVCSDCLTHLQELLGAAQSSVENYTSRSAEAMAAWHVGWVADGAGGHRGQMAVLVRPNGILGNAYLAAIAPFRHLIVYPLMMRDIGHAWRQRSTTPSQAGRP